MIPVPLDSVYCKMGVVTFHVYINFSILKQYLLMYYFEVTKQY
jgi:hypothetical protein